MITRGDLNSCPDRTEEKYHICFSLFLMLHVFDIFYIPVHHESLKLA